MKTQDQTIDWETELPLHREWMVRIAQFRLRDSHCSEDVVQDVFLSVVRQNPQLDDSNKIRSWLYQAVVRRVADHLRSQYRQVRVVDELSGLEENTQEDVGWDWMLANEQWDFLEIAIERLSKLDREIVLLKFTRNWSYKQLGERFGLAERSVEYRLVRAKQQLRTELQRLNGSEHEQSY
jgi:RNA polymerase sigma factor (sigma-70 family)